MIIIRYYLKFRTIYIKNYESFFLIIRFVYYLYFFSSKGFIEIKYLLFMYILFKGNYYY